MSFADLVALPNHDGWRPASRPKRWRTTVLALGGSALVHLMFLSTWHLPECDCGGTPAVETPSWLYIVPTAPAVGASTAPKPKKVSRPPRRPAAPAPPAPPAPMVAEVPTTTQTTAQTETGADPTPATISSVMAEAPISVAPPAADPTPPEPVPTQTDVPVARALPDLPAHIRLRYRLSSSIADGSATMVWSREGTRYEIDSTTLASGFFAEMLVGALRQTSSGEITPDGLRPSTFVMRRGEGEPDEAEFMRQESELRVRARGERKVMSLPPDLQDMQSFLFQFAFDGATLKTTGDPIQVVVTNARKIYRYRFRLVGEETLKTGAGSHTTLHLRSDADDPTDVYEVWLSPQHYWLPLKVRFFAGRFPVEQLIEGISIR